MELENLLQKILFPLEKKTSTILHPNDVDNDTSSDDYYSDEDDFYDENINEYDGIPSLR